MSDGISSINSSLYFSAAHEAAKEASKKKKIEQTTSKKLSFAEVLKKNKEADELLQAGFPAEIINMDIEDAAVFLKDKVDEAGERLSEDYTPDAFSSYRLAVNQFVKYIVKNNFNVTRHKRLEPRKKLTDRPRKQRDPFLQIQVINQKLDMMAADMLSNHMSKLKVLARVNEIQGLVVDLLAN